MIEEAKISESNSNKADDFFSKADEGYNLTSFFDEMKVPKEKIEIPEYMKEAEELEEELQIQKQEVSKEDQQMAEYLDYNDRHKNTADFILIQIDKAMGFLLGLISGLESEKYRKRQTRPKGDDYEREVLAALIKKYEVGLSLEVMFFTAITMTYGPAVQTAIKDRKSEKKKRAIEERKLLEEEVLRTAKRIP